jgi:hypothetical protein
MKYFKILLVCFLLSFNSKTVAQTYRFKTSSFSMMEKDTKGKWGKWSDFKKAEMIITLDGKKDRIIINSREMQLFKIVSYGEKIVTVFDETIPFECEDNEGGTCTILIVTRKNQNNRMQFYVNYNDTKMVYNIYNDN